MILVQTQPSDVQTSRSVRQKYGWYVVALVPILLHLWVVYRFSVNIPYIDDYTFLADCLHWQPGTLTLTDKLKHLFHPHGEHIILFARLVVLADYWLEGHLNFRTLFFVGNATLVGTVWIMYRLARRGGLQPWQFLPVVFLLFQPQYYENTLTWAICAVQHLPALFFAFLAFDLISRRSKRAFLLGLPTAFLAVFSNGNGLAVLIVGVFLLLILGKRTRLLVWLGFTLLGFGLYYYIHHVYQSPDVASNLTHPIRVVAGFFLMAGSVGLLFTRSPVALTAIGLFLMASMGLVIGTGLLPYIGFRDKLNYLPDRFRQWLTRWSSFSINKPSLVLAMGYGYVIITLLGISFARSIGWYQALLLPRFVGFATVALATSYLLILVWVRPMYRSQLSRISILVSLLFNGMAYWFSFGEAMTIRQSLLSDLHNWRETGIIITLPPYTSEHDQFYSDILKAAVQKGIYRLPESIIEPALRELNNTVVSSDSVIAQDSSFALGNRQIHCLSIGNSLPATHALDVEGAYLVLQSRDHTFVWPVDRSNTKLAQYLITDRSDWPANMVWVFADQLPLSSYRPSLVWFTNGKWTGIRSNQVLTIGTRSTVKK